jgi:hypothetical protein
MHKFRITLLPALIFSWCIFAAQAPAEGLESRASITGDVAKASVVKAVRGSAGIMVLSKSEISELTAGKFVQQYREIDGALEESIIRGLREYGLHVVPAITANELTNGDRRQILSYKLEKVEYGFKNPFGRHTNIAVSYVFCEKDGTVLSSGQLAEFSTKGWRNCVRAISQKMSADISLILSGKTPEGVKRSAGDGKEPLAQERTIEERLRQLDGLQAKGLVTPEEYRLKREEILKGL